MDNLTVVIPFRNGDPTLGHLLATIPEEIPVVVVDDLSTPLQRHFAGRAPTWWIELGQRVYFSGAVNAGLKACSTDVLVLNQDVWFEGTDWLRLINEERRRYALIGDAVMGHPAWPLGYVQGTFMFMRRDAIEKVGPLNAWDYPLWGSTCEWQLRAVRSGFEVLPCKVRDLRHARQGSFGTAITSALREQPDQQKLFVRTPPAISVVITSHNYGRYLPDAIHSLLGGSTMLGPMAPQSFASFEVIIVDDGSTDGSAEIAQALADPWAGVWFHGIPRKVGSAAAMNAGVRIAHGKYIAPLDGDDLMESERLQKLYRTAEANPHSVVYDDLMVVKGGARLQKWPLPEYDFDLVLNKNPMHKGLFYPKQAWTEAGGYPEIMTSGREDWAFNIAVGGQRMVRDPRRRAALSLSARGPESKPDQRRTGLAQSLFRPALSIVPKSVRRRKAYGLLWGK